MASKLGSDTELATIVQRAPRLALAAGQLRHPGSPTVESVLDPAAREIVVTWIRDGGFDAVAEIVADDPDLAAQELLNMLSAEALAVAVVIHADILVGVPSTLLIDGARDLGVDCRVAG